MAVKATTKSVRISTRKVRLVADVVRNMSVQQAIVSLSLINKRSASVLAKTIKSAVANAVNNQRLSEEQLIIEKLEVQEGAFLKRFRPSTRGRVHPFKKRSSHITVYLKEKTDNNINTVAKTEKTNKKEEKGEEKKKK